MKKICVDARLLGFSGIGTYLFNILPRILKNKEFEFTIIVKRKMGDKYPFLEKAKIIETDIPIFSIKELLFFQNIVPKTDIFWTPHFNMSLKKPPAKKILLTLCDTYHLHFFQTLKIHEKFYAKYLLSLFVKRASKIITISDFSKQEIEKYFNRYPEIKKIYCGVDLSRFNFLENNILSKEKYFLFVGTHKKHKNLKNLLKGFEKFILKHDAFLYICGTAKGMHNSVAVQSFIQSVQAKNRIKFFEEVPVEQLPMLYQNALGFVFPSFYEGFGLPPLEAMACGCPTIVSNAASLPEVCGDASLYIDPNDPDSISNALTTIAKNDALRKELCKKGFVQAKKFTWDQAAKEHLDVLRNL